ncbi:phage head-tail joining protein [Desulfosporosinus acididurans]|uniref:Phage head-tail joining protein n=2 Tax=Desulfosporosinus acididurans TaxID=476652 RepID=A0A0J1FRU9_9FIRM|nr:phage head-tail joining protein [Desulfosporosinus acididurans]
MNFDMRSSITLQARPTGQNPIGGTLPLVDVATFRAAYVPNNGRMYPGAGQIHTETDCEFRMRYSPLPQPGMYVRFNNNTYYIQTVDDEGGLHRELRIICKLEK